MAHTFVVIYTPESDGSGWNAAIPAVKGCISCGRSLSEARRNIREALSLFEEDFKGEADAVARDAIFEEDVRLPRGVQAAIKRYAKARARAEAGAASLRGAANAAAVALTKRSGVSLRDAGELLGLSAERVRKVLQEGEERA
jgi:predicted RNase H-like HicB family nuclease